MNKPVTSNGTNFEYEILDATHIKMKMEGTNRWGIPLHFEQLQPEVKAQLQVAGLATSHHFVYSEQPAPAKLALTCTCGHIISPVQGVLGLTSIVPGIYVTCPGCKTTLVIPVELEKARQRQDSLMDQIEDLIPLCTRLGMYDAGDYLVNMVKEDYNDAKNKA